MIEDPASDTAIVYSEHGFGPKNPWGLVSRVVLCHGMDSGWFPWLEDAFVDSFMGSDLAIWNVVERAAKRPAPVMASGLTLGEAFTQRDALNVAAGTYDYDIEYRGSRR